VFNRQPLRQHKKADMVFRKKIHAAGSADPVEEPEAGRMIQSPVSNLVIGAGPRPARITHATSDRVGACEAKLLNGFCEHHWPAGLQLPFPTRTEARPTSRKQSRIIRSYERATSRYFSLKSAGEVT